MCGALCQERRHPDGGGVHWVARDLEGLLSQHGCSYLGNGPFHAQLSSSGGLMSSWEHNDEKLSRNVVREFA